MTYSADERRLYAEYRAAGKVIERAALGDFLSVFDMAQTSDADKMVAALIPIYTRYVEKYGAAMAALAADFYDDLRALAVENRVARTTAVLAATRSFTAAPAPLPDVEALAANVRFAAGSLYGKDASGPDAMKGRLEGAMLRQVRNTGRRTLIGAARDEIRQTGKGPQWARILKGEDNCDWCITLASRGAVYMSEKTARSQLTKRMGQFHDNCDCEIHCVRDNGWPAGYDLAKVQAMYEQVKARRAGEKDATTKG